MKDQSSEGAAAGGDTKPARTRGKSRLPKLIDKYYADLKDLADQNVLFESGISPAFHALLAAAGKEYQWTLIAQEARKINGNNPPRRNLQR